MHRDKFLIIKPTRCTNFWKFYSGRKLYIFQTVPLSIIRSFHCTHSNGICHTGLLTACSQAVSKPVRTAVCTVENSWWGTEELSKTSRDSFQDKYFEKLVHLVASIVRKILFFHLIWAVQLLWSLVPDVQVSSITINYNMVWYSMLWYC